MRQASFETLYEKNVKKGYWHSREKEKVFILTGLYDILLWKVRERTPTATRAWYISTATAASMSTPVGTVPPDATAE